MPMENQPATDDVRYQRALAALYCRLNYERTPDAAHSLQDFRLHVMRRVLAELDNPQETLATVHLAGSKGKGSTATMVARIAEAAGYRVGLFTSPHVDCFEERFTVNGVAPSRKQVADLFDQLDNISQTLRQADPAFSLTFFETATALGWMHFQQQQVDLAVVEVGLGGRLDSTNICRPLVTVITSISRDHTRLLGNTLALIAREKAGIIKPGIPVITNVTDPDAAQVTAEIAQQQSAPQFRLGMEFRHQPQLPTSGRPDLPVHYNFDFTGMGVYFRHLQVGMPGEHQTRNGALATAVSLLLRDHGFQLSETAIRQGLLNTHCPLRVEVLQESPLVIVDAAHNPASVAALCETVQQVRAEKRLVIFACSRDKETHVLLSLLNESMDEIWLTRFTNNPRAIEFKELEHLAAKLLTKPWKLFSTPLDAVTAARTSVTPRDLVCFTGSFFLATEAKSILQQRPL